MHMTTQKAIETRGPEEYEISNDVFFYFCNNKRRFHALNGKDAFILFDDGRYNNTKYVTLRPNYMKHALGNNFFAMKVI